VAPAGYGLVFIFGLSAAGNPNITFAERRRQCAASGQALAGAAIAWGRPLGPSGCAGRHRASLTAATTEPAAAAEPTPRRQQPAAAKERRHNGVGSARIRLGERRVCFTLRWSRIAPPTAAHIHVGPPGVAGPVVVPLFAAPGGLPPELSGVSGCVTGVDPALIRAIRRHPRQYYVNIHNAPFPDGAIRSQLHHAAD
jgi:CHRD domain